MSACFIARPESRPRRRGQRPVHFKRLQRAFGTQGRAGTLGRRSEDDGVRGLLNGAAKGFVDLFGSWAPWVYIAALASVLIWALLVRLTRGKRSN